MERARRALGVGGVGPAFLDHVFQQACLDICEAVGATRASIWFFGADGRTLDCACLYDCRTEAFGTGARIREEEAPAYFAAMRRDGAVRAVNARTDPATSAFRDGYFAEAGIVSLLDHVVFADGEPVSVLCAEACGEVRAWTDADRTYLSQMAILLGIAIQDRRGRPPG